MGIFADVCVGALVIAIVSCACYGMFGDIDGGRMPTNDWFGYHPVFTVLGIPGFMTMGRWAYFLEGDTMDKSDKRMIHRACMTCGLIFGILGYVCIFMTQWGTGNLFGYNFESHEWLEWKWVAHVALGYSCLILALAQTVMGFLKLEALKVGERRFTFHGTLGKAIMVFGSCAVLVATYLWDWSSRYKAIMMVLAGSTALAAIVPHKEAGGVELAPLV